MGDDIETTEGVGTGVREEVFGFLVVSDEPQTPTDIADEIDTKRQQVQYHLDVLVRMGLAVPATNPELPDDEVSQAEDGEYVCQPALNDDELAQNIEAMLISIAPSVDDSVVVPEELDGHEEAVINNTIKMAVSLRL